MPPKRYFLDTDHDAHWYIVPLDKKDEWDAWLYLPGDNEESWEPPEFVIRVGGHPSRISFTDPIEEELK